jgi:hypothetical protein
LSCPYYHPPLLRAERAGRDEAEAATVARHVVGQKLGFTAPEVRYVECWDRKPFFEEGDLRELDGVTPWCAEFVVVRAGRSFREMLSTALHEFRHCHQIRTYGAHAVARRYDEFEQDALAWAERTLPEAMQLEVAR